jgi:hypothetical protein
MGWREHSLASIPHQLLAYVPYAPFSIFPFIVRVSFHHVLDTWLHIRSHVRCLWRIRRPWLKEENCRPHEASQLGNGRAVPGMSTLLKGTETSADLVELADTFWRPPPSDIHSAQEQDCRLALRCRHDDVQWHHILAGTRPTEVQDAGAGHTTGRTVFDWRLGCVGV